METIIKIFTVLTKRKKKEVKKKEKCLLRLYLIFNQNWSKKGEHLTLSNRSDNLDRFSRRIWGRFNSNKHKIKITQKEPLVKLYFLLGTTFGISHFDPRNLLILNNLFFYLVKKVSKSGVRAEINGLRVELQSQIEFLRTEMQTQIDELRAELRVINHLLKVLIAIVLFGMTMFNPAFFNFLQAVFVK